MDNKLKQQWIKDFNNHKELNITAHEIDLITKSYESRGGVIDKSKPLTLSKLREMQSY